MPTRNYDFSVNLPDDPRPIGRVIVGVPDDQMIALKTLHPDDKFKGEDPNVQFSIRDNISGSAKERILVALNREPSLEIDLSTQAQPTSDLIQDGPPTFMDNGKSFWVLPWEPKISIHREID